MVTPYQLLGGTLIAVAVVVGVLGMSALAVVAIALVMTLASGAYFVRRIGGITGDALGAANQIVELSVYLLLAGRW